MSEHQWTVVIVGAATIMAFVLGRIAERVEIARQKQAEFDARRWHDEKVRITVGPPDA